MKRNVRAVALVLFLIIALSLMATGYATITRQLLVQGNLSVEPAAFYGVYISEVALVSETGISNHTYTFSKPTNFKNSLTVLQSSSPAVTYRVVVHNNTDVSYWYLGVDYESAYGINHLIGQANGIFITTKDHIDDANATFDTSDWIPPQTYRTFYVTYRFGTDARARTGDMMVNFRFGLHMDAVQDEFLRLLNDKTSENGYNYIASAFADKYDDTGSTVIGNIGADAAIFDTMFGTDLRVNINGEELPVTVMIERKNVDGKETGDSYSGGAGCEYTVYLTTDALDGGTPTVYAVSYTCDANGVWRQIGELYEGTCSVEPYENSGENGMNLSSWRAVKKTYNVTDKISYNVGYPLGQGRDVDQFDEIAELMGKTDTEFYNMVNNNSSNLLKPVCLIVYSYRDNKTETEHENPDNKYNPGYDLLKAAFDAIKPYCYIGNGAQEVKLQNASALSRAELIPLLERVQNAYDYYLSVN